MKEDKIKGRSREYDTRIPLAKSVVVIAAAAIVLYFTWNLGHDDGLNQPLRCKSPIDPELHIIEADGKLDTTWVYARNNGFNVKVEPVVVYGIGN